MKMLGKIAKTGLAVFLFGLLPLAIFTLITSKSGVISGIRSFTVVTGSMEPIIPVGSIIFTTKSPSYELGDIVSVTEGDKTITHRIFQVLQSGGDVKYVLKGDANNAVDQKSVTASEIIGKQEVMIPEIGKFSAFIRTPVGFMSFVVTPAILLILFELVSIKKEMEIQIENRVRKQMEIRIQ